MTTFAGPMPVSHVPNMPVTRPGASLFSHPPGEDAHSVLHAERQNEDSRPSRGISSQIRADRKEGQGLLENAGCLDCAVLDKR